MPKKISENDIVKIGDLITDVSRSKLRQPFIGCVIEKYKHGLSKEWIVAWNDEKGSEHIMHEKEIIKRKRWLENYGRTKV